MWINLSASLVAITNQFLIEDGSQVVQ